MKVKFLKDYRDMNMYGGGDAYDYCLANGEFVDFNKGDEFKIVKATMNGFLIKLKNGKERHISNALIRGGDVVVVVE